MNSGVYFIRAGRGSPIKIGHAGDVVRRARGIQTGCHEIVKIIGVISGAGQTREQELHEEFKANRVRGEWFQPSAEMIRFIRDHTDFYQRAKVRIAERMLRRRKIASVFHQKNAENGTSDIRDAIMSEVSRRKLTAYGLWKLVEGKVSRTTVHEFVKPGSATSISTLHASHLLTALDLELVSADGCRTY